MRGVMRALAVAAALAAAGCPGGDDTGPAQPLELGLKDAEGHFIPLGEDDTVPVVLGSNGLNMIVPSLRAVEINPRAPDPRVVVEVAGLLMAADIEGSRVDMMADDVGYVLWDLRVPFQTELCCYVCGDGIVTASIRDGSGRRFEGHVRVRLERGGCPDVTACCASENDCPDPTLTQVCM